MNDTDGIELTIPSRLAKAALAFCVFSCLNCLLWLASNYFGGAMGSSHIQVFGFVIWFVLEIMVYFTLVQSALIKWAEDSDED